MKDFLVNTNTNKTRYNGHVGSRYIDLHGKGYVYLPESLDNTVNVPDKYSRVTRMLTKIL